MFKLTRKIPEAVRCAAENGNSQILIIPRFIRAIIGTYSEYGGLCLTKTFENSGPHPALTQMEKWVNEIISTQKLFAKNTNIIKQSKNIIYVVPIKFHFIFSKNWPHETSRDLHLICNRICAREYFIATEVIKTPWQIHDGSLHDKYGAGKYICDFYQKHYSKDFKKYLEFPLDTGRLSVCTDTEPCIYQNWPIAEMPDLHAMHFKTRLDFLTSNEAEAKEYWENNAKHQE